MDPMNLTFRLRALPILGAIIIAAACGSPQYEAFHPQRAGDSQAIGKQEGSGSDNPTDTGDGSSSKGKSSTQTKPVETKTSTDTPPAPGAPKLAIRSTPSAAEIDAMRAQYAMANNQGGCGSCHGALATSAKRGRTAAQISGATGVAAHQAGVQSMKWPKDILDASDDGVDNAKLFASAMAAALK